MATISPEIQEFIKGKLAWVATSSLEGIPNSTPKGTLKLIDNSHLVFADLFCCKTVENLKANPNVAVTVVDEHSYEGYQFKGLAELLTSGPLFDQVAEQVSHAHFKLPPLRYVVQLTVDSIYDQSVGPHAGKRIA
jgi:predicted pyridoxine 5'-phosphate oxidase superfamily flavin-nucleotide-binding protein